jgi:hypothetical protein
VEKTRGVAILKFFPSNFHLKSGSLLSSFRIHCFITLLIILFIDIFSPNSRIMPLALPSAALSWEIVKDTHAFLIKQRTLKKPFSKVRNLNHFKV